MPWSHISIRDGSSQISESSGHPQRAVLHNEIHARPLDAMTAPTAISHVVMLCDAAQREASRQHLAALLRDFHLPGPDADSAHLCINVGSVRIRWELHTEFVTWSFSRTFDGPGFDERAPPTGLEAAPQDWLAALPGQLLSALHLWLLSSKEFGSGTLVKHVLEEDALLGATVADGFGEVYTDLTIHADGFARMVLLAGGMTARRLGRLVQQLIEIETYRMAALLGLPVARESAVVLASAERELAELAEAVCLADSNEEPRLLDRLTKLAGEVESRYAATHSRFSASAAYFELVDRRIDDIGESRLAGLQTIGEFMKRRLSPARSTCAWVARRQDALSQRVSRISNLLRTRVEIEQQQSSRHLLAAMNRRQGVQLKLHATVEGLSVAAITYYTVGLINYVAKGILHPLGSRLSAESIAAFAIPIVALSVWFLLRRLHHTLFHRAECLDEPEWQ
ncbi:DUF3422 family protein [Caenimonas soli]|uniref:DUF3422 family protein n=1 Tax=Caenimonas soli TaxID=2735555 RepID=UPI0015543A4F|nr:DUF3422 domain-containing protein [Caenimonas soli]NPC58184.1 DUF3422 domain-containing protein [Caenimonas soli]